MGLGIYETGCRQQKCFTVAMRMHILGKVNLGKVNSATAPLTPPFGGVRGGHSALLPAGIPGYTLSSKPCAGR